ncbi:MAG: 2-C-methyl-D-erythritol 4-phosphate cytidylyltransferase [Firmicutes bacterium]|nr:2-C-methyl-D-erythritol 4-phosphate cytidylyltransferase [Bacillota bacterium]
MEGVYAVVAAAGSGRRLGSETPKQYLPLAGKPLVVHSLAVLNAHQRVGGIVLVVGSGWEENGYKLARQYEITKLMSVVTGGLERQESVYRGLLAIPPEGEIVLIHDAARPFLTSDLISRMISAACRTGAAVPTVAVKDTIKVAGPGGLVNETLARNQLVAVQTPQSFKREIIIKAHEKAATEGFVGTDDAMLVERMGLPVELVPGDDKNIKITTPLDLKWARLLLTEINSSLQY